MLDLTLKKKLAGKELLFGTHTGFNNAIFTEILSSLGYDYLWIDTEHAAVDYAELVQMIGNAWNAGTPPLVRVTMNDRNHTKKVLEMGPAGLIFPMINTAEEAEAAVKYSLYPPHGDRGFGPQRAVRYGIDSEIEYLQKANETLCIFVQIESPEAIDNLPEMVKNPWIDGFIIGPMDLSCRAGCPCDVYGEKVTSLIRRASAIVNSAGKRFCLSLGAVNAEQRDHWISLGVTMLSTGNECSFILNGAKENLKLLRGNT